MSEICKLCVNCSNLPVRGSMFIFKLTLNFSFEKFVSREINQIQLTILFIDAFNQNSSQHIRYERCFISSHK